MTDILPVVYTGFNHAQCNNGKPHKICFSPDVILHKMVV